MTDTSTWDVVYAIDVETLNTSIAENMRTGALKIARLNWDSGTGTHLDCDIAAFGFSPDSNLIGDIVPVAILLDAGTLTFKGRDIPLNKVLIVAQMQMIQVENPIACKITLVPGKAFSVTVKVAPGVELKDMMLLTMALNETLSNAIKTFHPILAVVDKSVPELANLPWLAPRVVGHCFLGTQGLTGSDGTPTRKKSSLAILYKTGDFVVGNPPPPTNQSVSILPDGGGATFQISEDLLMGEVFYDAVARALFAPNQVISKDNLRNAVAGRLELAEGGKALKTHAGMAPLPLRTMDVDLSPLYALCLTSLVVPPTVIPAMLATAGVAISEFFTHGSFKLIIPMKVSVESIYVKLEGGRLHIRADVRASLSVGSLDLATIKLTTESYYRVTLCPDDSFKFVRDGNPTNTTPVVEAADWIKNSSKALEIILTVLGVIVTLVTEGEALVVMSISLAIIGGTVENLIPFALTTAISKGTGLAVPAKFADFLAAATVPVTFLDRSRFQARSISLDGGLRFQGQVVKS